MAAIVIPLALAGRWELGLAVAGTLEPAVDVGRSARSRRLACWVTGRAAERPFRD